MITKLHLIVSNQCPPCSLSCPVRS